MAKTCFVTGGCGFVGRHITKRLLAEGYSVWLLDDLSVGLDPVTWLPDGFSYVGQDVGRTFFSHDSQEVVFIRDDALSFFAGQLELGHARSFFALPVFDDVIHLASVVEGRAVIEGDPMAVAFNLAIDSIFFRWVVRHRESLGRVLFTSSSAAYPINLQTRDSAIALSESLIDFDGNLGMPDMTYGWGKLTGEYLSQIAARQYGVHVACVRPFSGYGGDQDQRYPIPAIARRAALREDPLVVWGSGEQGRDFVHIDDCVDALFLALDAIHDGRGVNLGSGTLTTFKEVAALFAELAHYSPVITPLTDKPEGVQSRYSDTTYMRELLGWEPRISLRDGFARVLAEQEELVGSERVLEQVAL